MSLSNSAKKWIEDSDEKFSTNFFYEDDGEKNMAAAQKYIDENGKSWDLFPVFSGCRSLGEGWYAPAIDELKDIVKAINGDVGKLNEKQLKVVEKTIKSHKGDALRQKILTKVTDPWNMLSSTEGEQGMVQQIAFIPAFIGKGKFEVMSLPKSQGGKMLGLGSRAVHKF